VTKDPEVRHAQSGGVHIAYVWWLRRKPRHHRPEAA
jgi:hypothetical protein